MRQTVLTRALAVTILTLTLATTGCLISATEYFSVFIGNLTASGGTFNSTLVDLEGEETYEDNKDKIRAIDRVGWSCRVVNNNAQAATVSVYASPNGNLNPAVVETQATPLFEDFSVPANGSRVITYDESLVLLSEESFRALQDMVLDGNFTFYATASGTFVLNIQDLELLVTFTVGL